MQYANGSLFEISYSRMYSPRMSVGNRLDEAMQKAGIPSQSALARASGVPQATISRILKGGDGRRGPETETLKRLAAACNVSFEWLNEGIGSQERLARHQAQSVPVAPAANDSVVSAEEIMELLNSYYVATPKERKQILTSAKLAAQRFRARKAGTTDN